MKNINSIKKPGSLRVKLDASTRPESSFRPYFIVGITNSAVILAGQRLVTVFIRV